MRRSASARQRRAPDSRAAAPATGTAAVLQRACACGKSAGVGGKCSGCDSEARFGAPPLQAKLTIGAPDDPYEREADAVADRLLRMDGPAPAPLSISPLVQRKASGPVCAAPGALASAVSSPASGAPLSPATRAYFEPRFGQDLSHVRVHADANAGALSEQVSARAFTVGSNIWFGRGAYDPASEPGRRLLGHELTHVIQQGGRQGPVQRKGGSFGGFFKNFGRAIQNIFTDECDYTPEQMETYLGVLRTTKDIEDDFDSDNKARKVVAAGLHKKETLKIRALLIREMITGYYSDDDLRGVRTIMGDSTRSELEELPNLFSGSEQETVFEALAIIDPAHGNVGDISNVRTMAQYIERWTKINNKPMTEKERQTLARGCVGITALETESLNNPDIRVCYQTFIAALKQKEKVDALLAAANQPNKRALIFSKRFHNEQPLDIDKRTRQVDMSIDSNTAKPGSTNFDYGLYDEATGKWWHANKCDPATINDLTRCVGDPMVVFESSLEHYSQPLNDFNRQVFCVTIGLKR
ncbi:MAG TPA: DUF4157 domain-containing protein [Allosphingosinicella sp.]|nr:DUF4157 domain-containing protein [Allosphingosinicella sp.]